MEYIMNKYGMNNRMSLFFRTLPFKKNYARHPFLILNSELKITE